MRWLRFATGARLSKLMHALLSVILVKLAVMGALTWSVSFSEGPIAVPSQEPAQQAAAAADTLEGSNKLSAMAKEPMVRAVLSPAVAWAEDNATNGAAPGGDVGMKALAKKQEELNRREKDLKQLEKQIDQKLAQMQELEAKLERMLEDAEKTKDKKLRHLVDVYSNMKAKQAATVLETLDEDIAVKILAGMRGRQAGEILTYVKASKAARLSEALTRMQIPFQ